MTSSTETRTARQEALLYELASGPATVGYLIDRQGIKIQFGTGYYEMGQKIHKQIYSTLIAMEKKGMVERIPNDTSREALWKALES